MVMMGRGLLIYRVLNSKKQLLFNHPYYIYYNPLFSQSLVPSNQSSFCDVMCKAFGQVLPLDEFQRFYPHSIHTTRWLNRVNEYSRAYWKQLITSSEKGRKVC